MGINEKTNELYKDKPNEEFNLLKLQVDRKTNFLINRVKMFKNNIDIVTDFNI